MKHTHSDRLERWLGTETVDAISANFGGFYHPVAIHGVPGNVHVMPGGDFTGEIKAGAFLSKEDGAAMVLKKLRAAADAKLRRNRALGTLLEMIRCNDGRLASIGAFSSIDAVVAAFTGGKGQAMVFQKTGVNANNAANSMDMWTRSSAPGAGAAASAAPGGTVPTAATTGAMGFKNLGAANSGHYLNWTMTASVTGATLMLYDRIFAVAKTMNSTGTEAVTGVPTRYTNTTPGNIQYCGGNFLFPSVPTTVLPGTAHNWTVCQYTDDGGNAGQSVPSATGQVSCVVGGIDLAAGQGSWFMPLAAGDVGLTALTQMQCSAAIATGTVDFVIGHPIAINVSPLANMACLDDGLYTAMNLTTILDDACLAFIEMPKISATATVFSGLVRAVSE